MSGTEVADDVKIAEGEVVETAESEGETDDEILEFGSLEELMAWLRGGEGR